MFLCIFLRWPKVSGDIVIWDYQSEKNVDKHLVLLGEHILTLRQACQKWKGHSAYWSLPGWYRSSRIVPLYTPLTFIHSSHITQRLTVTLNCYDKVKIKADICDPDLHELLTVSSVLFLSSEKAVVWYSGNLHFCHSCVDVFVNWPLAYK